MPEEEAKIAAKIFQISADYSRKLVDSFSDLGLKPDRAFFILVEFLALILHLTSRLTNPVFSQDEHKIFMNAIYRHLLAQFDAFLSQNQLAPADREQLAAYCADTLSQREKEYAQSKNFFPHKESELDKSIFWLFSQYLSTVAQIEGIGLTGETMADEALKVLGKELKASLSTEG